MDADWKVVVRVSTLPVYGATITTQCMLVIMITAQWTSRHAVVNAQIDVYDAIGQTNEIALRALSVKLDGFQDRTWNLLVPE